MLVKGAPAINWSNADLPAKPEKILLEQCKYKNTNMFCDENSIENEMHHKWQGPPGRCDSNPKIVISECMLWN